MSAEPDDMAYDKENRADVAAENDRLQRELEAQAELLREAEELAEMVKNTTWPLLPKQACELAFKAQTFFSKIEAARAGRDKGAL